MAVEFKRAQFRYEHKVKNSINIVFFEVTKVGNRKPVQYNYNGFLNTIFKFRQVSTQRPTINVCRTMYRKYLKESKSKQ